MAPLQDTRYLEINYTPGFLGRDFNIIKYLHQSCHIHHFREVAQPSKLTSLWWFHHLMNLFVPFLVSHYEQIFIVNICFNNFTHSPIIQLFLIVCPSCINSISLTYIFLLSFLHFFFSCNDWNNTFLYVWFVSPSMILIRILQIRSGEVSCWWHYYLKLNCQRDWRRERQTADRIIDIIIVTSCEFRIAYVSVKMSLVTLHLAIFHESALKIKVWREPNEFPGTKIVWSVFLQHTTHATNRKGVPPLLDPINNKRLHKRLKILVVHFL